MLYVNTYFLTFLTLFAQKGGEKFLKIFS